LALTPQNDETFLREVDDELRREQLATLWQRYGRVGIGLVVLLLALFAGTLWWRAETQKKADARGEQMSAAIADIQANRKADAQVKLSALADGSGGYRASAMFAKAALAADSGDKKGAIALYAGVAADSNVPQPYRDLALIRQTAIEYDSMPPAQVVERLKPLTVEGQPWFGTAGEMTAIAYLDMKRPADAGRMLAAVARDEQVPQSLRSRARRLAATLGADVDTPAAAQKD
jgi:hypothetical protein